MAIDVQQKLIAYGASAKYFINCQINMLEKSCCSNCLTTVIDFDKTKEVIVAKYNWVSIKSCDALLIYSNKVGIDFIEMKSSASILSNPKITTVNKLTKQVNKFNFSSKIVDSLTILHTISNENASNLTGSERKKLHTIKKNYIILTDISIESNPLEFIAFSLDHLANFSSSLSVLLQEAVNKLEPNQLNGLNKPKLMDCDSFIRYVNS